MKQRSGSSSLSALKLKSFASLVKWCAAHYTHHMKGHVSLRVVCERTHRFRKITGSVNEPKSDHPGTNHGTHFPCIFRNGCVNEASDWRWTWRRTDVAFWLKMKIGLTSIWCWLNVGFWLHNLKTTKSQRQLTSVLDINLTLTLNDEFTLNFGYLTSQLKFNQISTSYDVVCLRRYKQSSSWDMKYSIYCSMRVYCMHFMQIKSDTYISNFII